MRARLERRERIALLCCPQNWVMGPMGLFDPLSNVSSVYYYH